MTTDMNTVVLALAIIDDKRAGRETKLFPHARRDWGLIALAATIIGLAALVSSCEAEKSRVAAAAALNANTNSR